MILTWDSLRIAHFPARGGSSARGAQNAPDAET
jgi:hypothetical protein